MVRPSTWLPALAGTLCLMGVMTAQAQGPDACPTSGASSQPTWDKACAAAIEQEQDSARKAELLFRRAYVLNAREDYEHALEDLDAASALVPHQAKYLHERGYTLNSLRRYQEALISLDEDVALKLIPQAYDERALARFHMGDWEGSFADRDQSVKLNPGSAGALLTRTEARLWLGLFALAREDLKASASLAQSSGENADGVEDFAGVLEAWTHHSKSGDPTTLCLKAESEEALSQTTLIGDCTVAFLHARTPKEKADALTQRGNAWQLARHSLRHQLTDYELAAVLAPNDSVVHMNLGFACLQLREDHARTALQEFNRSLALHPQTSFPSLGGRAHAYYKLRELDLAFRDAKASAEIKPNILALWLMGDISRDKGDMAAAKRYWMDVYRLGARDDRLMESLRSVGVKDPAAEPGGR